MIVNDDLLSQIFVRDKKCVINTDLDGLLSGMLLQEFLNWEIVGFSSCCGRDNDNLWLKDGCLNIKDYVFVDLPVATKNITTIDQHFVAFENDSIIRFNNCANKINPNIMRSRVFKNNDYINKYPFGTVHFILATLERLNLLPQDFSINFYKSFENYDLADLFLRADRVIGNTYSYTRNCIDWSNWMIEYGDKLSQALFNIVKLEYPDRYNREHFVEEKLQQLGCAGLDGDCSNLFRRNDKRCLNDYFEFLARSLDMRPLPLFDFFSYDNLYGERIRIENNNLEEISNLLKQESLFSYAFVTMKTLSITYKKRRKNE